MTTESINVIDPKTGEQLVFRVDIDPNYIPMIEEQEEPIDENDMMYRNGIWSDETDKEQE